MTYLYRVKFKISMILIYVNFEIHKIYHNYIMDKFGYVTEQLILMKLFSYCY